MDRKHIQTETETHKGLIEVVPTYKYFLKNIEAFIKINNPRIKYLISSTLQTKTTEIK